MWKKQRIPGLDKKEERADQKAEVSQFFKRYMERVKKLKQKKTE